MKQTCQVRDLHSRTCTHVCVAIVGVIALTDAIKANARALSLNISSNNLGQLVFPAGWNFKKGGMFSADKWVHADGRKQKDKPADEPAGVIAIAEAIPTMAGAMTSLNISNNTLGGQSWYGEFDSGIKALAEAIPKCK